MSTREKLKFYLKVTGAEQKWVADSVGISKTTINRFLSDKDDYEPKKPIKDKIEALIQQVISNLENLR